jgi:hypothetical protein
MKRRGTLTLAFLIVLVMMSTLLVIVADVPAKAPAAAAAPEMLGSKDTAKWTDTTTKAAATSDQKAVLAGGKIATITGELVDVSCYLQLGKKGEAHIPCGSDCIKHGQPAGLLDKDGKLTVLFVEEHDPRRKGEIDVKDKLAALVAKQVTATGMLTQKDGYAALYVQGSEIAAAK